MAAFPQILPLHHPKTIKIQKGASEFPKYIEGYLQIQNSTSNGHPKNRLTVKGV